MDNERRFYTYAYLREDGTPYYIGKGSGKRAFENEGRTCKRPPRERILLLKQNLTEKEAFKHEIYMIALYGRKDLGTGILRNLTAGGDGVSGYIITKERRKQISEATRGVPKTKEHRQKIREALLRKAANKGKTWCYNPDNPGEEKLCLPQDIPQAWVKGRVIPEQVKQKFRKPKKLDPIREKRRKELLSQDCSARRWFHNPEGDKEKFCHEGDQPEGWQRGRTVKKKVRETVLAPEAS